MGYISTQTDPEQVTAANPWPPGNETPNKYSRKQSMKSEKKPGSTIDQHYSEQEWVRLYTDGSPTDADKNDGGGVL